MPRIASILFLLLAACSAFAADYRLSIDAPADQLAKAKTLRIYGFKFAKGDRIVSITAGSPGGSSSYRVTLDSGSASGTSVANNRTANGFKGKVIFAPGQAPTSSASASIDKVVPAEPQNGGVIGAFVGFVTSTAGYVTFGCLAALFAVTYLIRRPRSTGETWALPNRRKAIDESLKDITRRLEQIDQNQRELVKKPPVLRSFRNQINNFDSRLKQLEGQLVKTGDSLGALDRGQHDLKARAESSDLNAKALSDSLDAAKQSLADLNTALHQLGKEQSGKTGEVLSSFGKQALEIQSRLASLDNAHTEHFDELKQIEESRHQNLQDQLTDLASKEVDLAPVQSSIAALQQKQLELAEQLAALAAKDVDLKPVTSSLNDLRDLTESLKNDQARLAEDLASKEIDLTPVQSTLDELRATLEGLQKEQATTTERLNGAKEFQTTQTKTLMKGFEEMSRENEKARASMLWSAEQSFSADDKKRLLNLAEQQSKVENSLNELREKLDQLTSASDPHEATDQQKLQVEALANLSQQLELLQKATNQSAAAIEAKIADVSARTDQRESILLSLQSRVSDSEGQSNGASEVLPMIADLRLELQSLASDQAKVSASLDSLSEAMSKVNANAESNVQTLIEDQAKLAATLSEIGRSIDNTRSGPTTEAPSFDESRFQASFDALSASLAQWKAEAEANQQALEERLAAAVANSEGVTISPSPIDEARFQRAFDSLSTSLSQWKAETDANNRALEDRLAALKQSEASTPAFSESKLQAAIEALSASLSQWKTEAEAGQRAFEGRIAAELASGFKHREQTSEPVIDHSNADEKHHKNERFVIDVDSMSDFEFNGEAEPQEKPVLHLDIESTLEETSEKSSNEAPSQTGWPAYAGSQSRRWSASVDRPFMVVASDKHLSALTPIITPVTEFKLGPVLYMGKKVLYGHGPNLKGMWPGRGEQTAALQEEVPNDPWRIATLDGHAFCVEEDQVEIVSLAAWRVVARLSGSFIDQITTKTHWVGLAKTFDKLSLDYRNLRGRQLGDPIKLPIRPDDVRGLMADGERVFVASRDGKVYGVELGEVKELASPEKGDLELLSIAAGKTGLVAVVRTKDGDVIRLYSFDGKTRKQTPLGFTHGFDHSVLIEDRLYLVDAENRKLMACNLKKLEVSEVGTLPGNTVSAFCGMFHGDQHALLLSVAEKEQAGGHVLAIDAKTGATRTVCDVSERKIQVVAADGRVVVASSTFYQNTIRVFDPFSAEAQKAA